MKRFGRLFSGGSQVRRKRRLYFRFGLIILTAISGYFFSMSMQEKAYGKAAMVSVAITFFALFEFVIVEYLSGANYPPKTEELLDRIRQKLDYETDKGIRNSLDRCVQSLRGVNQAQVSMVAHLPIEVEVDKEIGYGLVQLTHYAGSKQGGKELRITDARLGLIGRCLRTGTIQHVNFSDRNEYLMRMVEEFGFSRQQAESHTDARSYLAYPVIEDSKVKAILYCFSTNPRPFPHGTNDQVLAKAGQEILNLLGVAKIL